MSGFPLRPRGSCSAPQEYAEGREKQPCLPEPDSSSSPQAPLCLDEAPQASLADVCPALPSGSRAIGSSSSFPLWNCHHWRHSDLRWDRGWHPCLCLVHMNMTMSIHITNPSTRELKFQLNMPPAWERGLYPWGPASKLGLKKVEKWRTNQAWESALGGSR